MVSDRRVRSSWSFVLWFVVCAGCGASSSFNGHVFEQGGLRYRVGALSPGFERIQVGDNDLAWHDRRYGTISVNATCKRYDDVPARALMNHLLFGTTDRVLRVEETVTLDGRGAEHLIADVSLDGVPVTIDVYLVVKDGCVYDLTLVSGREQAAAARPLFEAFAQQFAVLSSPVQAR